MISKAIIEIPKGSVEKREYDGMNFVLDRILPIPCPQNYGFIPGTLAPDGDAVDVFVVTDIAINTGIEVEVELLGKFICFDQGISDDKYIAVLKGDARQVSIGSIQKYLQNYKEGFYVEQYCPVWEES